MSFVCDGDDAPGAWKYDGLKCLNCGYITDPLFVKNRELTRSVAAHQPASEEYAVIAIALVWFTERAFGLQLFPL